MFVTFFFMFCNRSTESYDGDKFFTMVDGVKRATPLLLVLVCVELSDVRFMCVYIYVYIYMYIYMCIYIYI